MLTKRQKQILILFAKGWEKNEIAKKLGIKPASIKSHSVEISNRLGARNIRHAICLALLDRQVSILDILINIPIKENKERT